MKVLCVCDYGSCRSVQIAHRLRFAGHDTLAVGVKKASRETLELLAGWADVVIFTDPAQQAGFPVVARSECWPIPDVFRRPLNSELDRIVMRHVREFAL